jgi:hypothetical protein
MAANESIGSSTDSRPETYGGSDHNISKTTNSSLARVRDVEKATAAAFKELPASQTSEANINFLGSSYSGVDLKVVAHMYDDAAGNEGERNKLEARRERDQHIVDGANNLLAGGLDGFGGLDGLATQQALGNPLFFTDFPAKRELFIAATGIPFPGGQEADRAVNLLVGNVLQNRTFSFINIAQMKQICIRLRAMYQNSVTETESRIEDLEKLRAAGNTGSQTIVLGTLQTISIQSFREKNAVRALGHSYAKGYTRGTRTIGGSMIFTIFNEHALAQLIRGMGVSRTYGERDTEVSTLLPDQLPPIDLTLVFANEYGSLSDLRIYGCEFVTDGQVFSIEDLLSEGTMNFVCRDADIMTSRGRIGTSRAQRSMFNSKDDKDLPASQLLFDNASYNRYLDRLGTRRRLTNR